MVNMAFWKKDNPIYGPSISEQILKEENNAVLESLRQGRTQASTSIPTGKAAITDHLENQILYLHDVIGQRDDAIIKLKQDRDDLLQKNSEIRQLSRKMLEENERLEKRLDDV